MEKFYIVPEGTKLHADYFKWKECEKELMEIAKDIMQSHGMRTTVFAAGRGYFGIDPTPADAEKFAKDLRKNEAHGVRMFKVKSAVLKEWDERTKHIEVMRKPIVCMYFSDPCGKTRYRLFSIDGVVYCSFESEFSLEPKEPFLEIKASEFYRAIEEWEEWQKGCE